MDVKEIQLTCPQKKQLLKSSKSKEIHIMDNNLCDLLLKYGIIHIDVNCSKKTFKLTDKGEQYVELLKEELSNRGKDNLKAWVSLICSITAIIISIISLFWNIYGYYRSKEINNDINETTNEIIEHNNTAKFGIE